MNQKGTRVPLGDFSVVAAIASLHVPQIMCFALGNFSSRRGTELRAL